MDEVQHSWQRSPAVVLSTLGVPTPDPAHGGRVGEHTGAVTHNLGSTERIAGKNPLFSPNTRLHEHLCPTAQQPAPVSACSFSPASGTLLSWSDDSEKNKLDK